MRAKSIVLIVSIVFAASLFADAKSQVVTNAAPAVNASMTLVSADPVSGFTWQVSGKVRPEFRGFGASAHLVCTQYNALLTGSGATLVFPQDNGGPFFSGPNVDACGNFSFLIRVVGDSPQLDPTFVCNFVVHADGPQSPQSCGEHSTTSGADPNGTAPCSGGYCPGAAK
jgi:hypothetical protein